MTNWDIVKRLVAAPFMGLAFVVFLPVIGFVLVGKFAWEHACMCYRRITDSAAAF